MSPNRFRDKREKRELTPFIDEPIVQLDIPEEWRKVEAPINFTWVIPDELAGMGWPKSRDQLRFLLDQGIDQLVTLSADKIPPYYAFPELRHSLIPVEDFKGPAISDIQRFINIMDDARKQGEAVAVHCAEGRGRTGVMCACYLIYYHDLKPWDAIRIMRRQRPGSVERRTQEDTVVRFYNLLQEYGKQSLEVLDEKEREWLDERRREKDSRRNCENLLGVHTASFYGPVSAHDNRFNRQERILRMRRCRSMPKMTPEEENSLKSEVNFQNHVQNFYQDQRCRSQPRDRTKNQHKDMTTERNGASDDASGGGGVASVGGNGVLKGNTPTRILKDNLKPVSIRKLDTSEERKEKCDYTKHFKQFMSGVNVKRARSFSQPKETSPVQKQHNPDEVKEKQRFTSEEKYVKDRDEMPEKNTVKCYEVRRSKSDSSRDRKCANVDCDNELVKSGRPPQPNFSPSCVVDTSSTYSYYTRVRSRAAAAAVATAIAARKEPSTSSGLEPNAEDPCLLAEEDSRDKPVNKIYETKDLRVKVTVKEVVETNYSEVVADSSSSSIEKQQNSKQSSVQRSRHPVFQRRTSSLSETRSNSSIISCQDGSREVRQLHSLDDDDNDHDDNNHSNSHDSTPHNEAPRKEKIDTFNKKRFIYKRSKTGPVSSGLEDINKHENGYPKSKDCVPKSRGESRSPFSRDNWKRINHRYNSSSLINASFTRETYV